MTRALIAEPDAELLQRMQAAVFGAGVADVSCSASLDSALAAVREAPPDILVIGPTLASEHALALASHVEAAHAVATVLVAPAVTSSLLRKAMRAGVADVASIEDTLEELTEAVESGIATAARARTGLGDSAGQTRGRILTVFSTKGGVGKTVLATNLAAALARDTGKRVALLDLDLEFGDVAIMLGIKPEHTIADVVQVYDRLDAGMLEGYMARHSSGLMALLAPVRPEDAETISVARVTQLIELLTANFDFLVIDTCPSFSEVVLAALDKSDEVYVVTMMDVASIKNTRISLQKLRQLGYDAGRLRIVLNRSDSKVLLEPSEVEAAIGDKVAAHIPSDRMVPRSVNKGVPVVMDMPKLEVSRSIVALAKHAAEGAKGVEDDA